MQTRSVRLLRLIEWRALKPAASGFTLLELLVVIIIVGLIAAIAAPSWFQFLQVRRLAAAQDIVNNGIKEAQSKAQQRNVDWDFALRENSGITEWSIYPSAILSPSTAANWQPLHGDIAIDHDNSYTNTLGADGIYEARFDYKGYSKAAVGGKLTLMSKNVPDLKRCVLLSTLLGATRMERDDNCITP
ncbi:MAG: type II secretion system protein [Cyanobacteria bacterium J06632_22]